MSPILATLSTHPQPGTALASRQLMIQEGARARMALRTGLLNAIRLPPGRTNTPQTIPTNDLEQPMHENSNALAERFPLLELPREIREMIYEAIIANTDNKDHPISVRVFYVSRQRNTKGGIPPLRPFKEHPMLLLNTKIRNEFLPLWHKRSCGKKLRYDFDYCQETDVVKCPDCANQSSPCHLNCTIPSSLALIRRTLDRLSRDELSPLLRLNQGTRLKELSFAIPINDSSTEGWVNSYLLSLIIILTRSLHPYLISGNPVPTTSIYDSRRNDPTSIYYKRIKHRDIPSALLDFRPQYHASTIITQFLDWAKCLPVEEVREEQGCMFALADFLDAFDDRVRFWWGWRLLWREAIRRLYGQRVAEARWRDWPYQPSVAGEVFAKRGEAEVNDGELRGSMRALDLAR